MLALIVSTGGCRGSTGYGREYREKLYGTWGITDIDDCCSAAEYLVSSQKGGSKGCF
jgi:dipeptidyl aminopeptidase/acylaminoacyl peptidase